jgi:hypothetical protein
MRAPDPIGMSRLPRAALPRLLLLPDARFSVGAEDEGATAAPRADNQEQGTSHLAAPVFLGLIFPPPAEAYASVLVGQECAIVNSVNGPPGVHSLPCRNGFVHAHARRGVRARRAGRCRVTETA